MTITVARQADLDDLREMLAEYQESLESVTTIDDDKNDQFLSHLMDDKNDDTLFIGRTSTGHAAAFAVVCMRLFTPHAEWVPQLMDLYVRETYRQKGFGRQFFDYILRWAKTNQHRSMHWQVENLNLTGQYMFDRYNPEIVGWVGYSLDLTKR